MSIEGSFLARISRGISKNSWSAAGGNFGAKKKSFDFHRSFSFGCPTWIRTKTNGTKNRRTTIILLGKLLWFCHRVVPF